MKLRRNSKSEENRAAAASLLADLEEEFSSPQPHTISETSKRPSDVTSSDFDRFLEPSAERAAFFPKNNSASNKALADREQSVSMPLAKVMSGPTENVSKALADREQSVSIPTMTTTAKTTKPLAYPLAEPLADQQQTVSKPLAKYDFDGLVGKEKDLIVLVFEKCQAAGSLESPILTTEDLCGRLKINAGRLRNLIFRLNQKQLLNISQLKLGRASQRRFSLPKDLFQQIHLGLTVSKPLANREQTVSKPYAYPLAEPLAAPSSSSRYLNIKESTTTEQVDLISRIDLTSVNHLGITTSVLARCIELYPTLKPEQLEVLAFRFAEFAKDPKNKVQNARGFFISLAEQASKGQVPLDHIETTDERLMRLFVSRQEEAKTRRVNFEQKAQDFECEAWLGALTSEMKLNLIPETSLLKAGTGAHTAMLKSHFADRIWPERKKQILTTVEANL
jgi:hypothetical protein